MSDETAAEPTDAEVSEQKAVRLAKRERLNASGAEAYPVSVPITAQISELRIKYADLEIDTAHPGLRASVPPEAWWFHSPDGETYAIFAARLQAALHDIQSDPTPIKIIVAHAVVSRVIRAQWAGLSELESHSLPVPQDAFFVLSGGKTITEIPA